MNQTAKTMGPYSPAEIDRVWGDDDVIMERIAEYIDLDDIGKHDICVVATLPQHCTRVDRETAWHIEREGGLQERHLRSGDTAAVEREGE